MHKKVIALAAAALLLLPGAVRAQDVRELVPLSKPLQDSFLVAMRDHLIVLDTILSHIASERYGEAARLADRRLGMHPFDPELEARLNAALPPQMVAAGESLREAARQLSKAAEQADRDRSYPALKGVTWAISDITAACNGCHAHYRIR